MIKKFLSFAALLVGLFSCSNEKPLDDGNVAHQTYDFEVLVLSHDNHPISNASVDIFTSSSLDTPLSTSKTSSEGKVVFSSLKVGKYVVKAMHEDLSTEITIAVTAKISDNHASIKFPAPKPTSFDFKVTLKSHKSVILPDRKLDLLSSSDEVLQSVMTDHSGIAFFKDLKPGQYKVRIYNALGEMLDQPATDITVVTNSSKNKKDITVVAYLHSPDIIIIGAMIDPMGIDSPKDGEVTPNRPVDFIHDKGGYEYIQLMALKDINFAEWPYAIVTSLCDDSSEEFGTSGHGWVESADPSNGSVHKLTTYQMNLTSGSVKKGQIFYVGGRSRMIASYYAAPGRAWFSPQVEANRWFSFDYYNNSADNNNGSPRRSFGLLGNLNEDQKTNIPDGIAVFGTINVDVSSVPQDVIFYGGDSQLRTTDKFRITNNDHYSTTDENGNPQPYFGQGSNTWFAKQGFHDQGCFIRMGGVYFNGEWVVPRSAEAIRFNVEKGQNSVSISDIEEGEGVTKVIFK